MAKFGWLLFAASVTGSIVLASSTGCSSSSPSCDTLCACPENVCASSKPTTESDCKSALDMLKAGGGCAMAPKDSGTMMGDSSTSGDAAMESGSMCMLMKGSACGTGSGCCEGMLDCGYSYGGGGSKACCVDLKQACNDKTDCCQRKSSDDYADCNGGKCCLTNNAANSCTVPTDCCSGKCEMGSCVP